MFEDQTPRGISRQIQEFQHKIHVTGCESCKKIYRERIAALERQRAELER